MLVAIPKPTTFNAADELALRERTGLKIDIAQVASEHASNEEGSHEGCGGGEGALEAAIDELAALETECGLVEIGSDKTAVAKEICSVCEVPHRGMAEVDARKAGVRPQ